MRRSLVFPALLLAALAAQAQTYPARPVRIISPQVAGSGPSEVSGRAIAQALGAALGQTFLVENRAGANGIIGAQAIAKAAPDGYTLGIMSASGISQNPFMYAELPYDPQRDFAPIVMIGFAHQALVAHPSVTANTLAEVIEQARAKPGAIAWGSFGPGSPSHLYIEWFKNARGIRFYNVPYKSAAQALQGVVAGEIQLAQYAFSQSVPLVKAGKVKALAVSGDKRLPELPGVPSYKESGIEVLLRNWYGYFAPAATPRDIVLRLNAEISKILLEPKFQEFLGTRAGLALEDPAARAPEEFAAFLKTDRETYRNIVAITGAKGD